MTETETLDDLVTRIRADPGDGAAWTLLSDYLWSQTDSGVVARFWADHPDLWQRVCVHTSTAKAPRGACPLCALPPRVLPREEAVAIVKAEFRPLVESIQALTRERDEARAEVTTLRAELASISAEFNLPPTIRPAEGEIRRMRSDLHVLTTEQDNLRENHDLALGFIRKVADDLTATDRIWDVIDAAREFFEDRSLMVVAWVPPSVATLEKLLRQHSPEAKAVAMDFVEELGDDEGYRAWAHALFRASGFLRAQNLGTLAGVLRQHPDACLGVGALAPEVVPSVVRVIVGACSQGGIWAWWPR